MLCFTNTNTDFPTDIFLASQFNNFCGVTKSWGFPNSNNVGFKGNQTPNLKSE